MKITWKKLAILLLTILVVYCAVYFGIKIYNDSNHSKVETEITLDQYDIKINDNTIIYVDGEYNQQIVIIKENDEYSLRITGETNRNYEFTIEDETGKTITFKYSFDDKKNLSITEK